VPRGEEVEQFNHFREAEMEARRFMRKKILRTVLSTGCGMILFATCLAGAEAAFETPSNRKASEILPAGMIKGKHYVVRDTVVSYGYMHRYTVDSEFGEFDVTGDGALRKLLKEIEAIAVLKEMSKTDVYVDALKKAGTMPVDFAKNLISNPVGTVTGVPKGVYRFFRNAATSVTSKRSAGQDDEVKSVLAVSAYKRELAYQLGVDVYSSNEVLQEELNRFGWAGAMGSLTVSAALLPVGGGAAMAFKGTRLSQQFNELLKDEPPPRLRQIANAKLTEMGISEELRKSFLDHPQYSVRHKAVIVGCLTLLEGASGRDSFLKYSLQADDEETANFFQNMAETMRGYNEKVSPIGEVDVVFGLVFAKAENGTVLIPFPLDHGVWTEQADFVIRNGLIRYRESKGVSGAKFEMWVTGTLSPLAKKRLEGLGVKPVEDVDKRIEFVD
jgi:hypothetical protein